jgi:hypothetical protein
MKKITITITSIMFVATFLFVSCSTPVGMTSWKNPQANAKISRVVVLALLDKLTYIQPFEQLTVNYFNSQNLKSIGSLDFMAPFQKYTKEQLQSKLDSVGADGLLILAYKGTDVDINTSPGFYGGYYGRWGGGGQVWTTTTVNLRAQLYDVKNDVLLWTGDLTLTDPDNTTSSCQQLAQAIYADWLKNNLLKNPPPPAQK